MYLSIRTFLGHADVVVFRQLIWNRSSSIKIYLSSHKKKFSWAYSMSIKMWLMVYFVLGRSTIPVTDMMYAHFERKKIFIFKRSYLHYVLFYGINKRIEVKVLP